MYVFFLLGRKATGAMRCIFKIVFFPRPAEYFDDTVSMDYLLPVASVKFFKRPIMGSDEMKLTFLFSAASSDYNFGNFSVHIFLNSVSLC